jgi:hypothetical protein
VNAIGAGGREPVEHQPTEHAETADLAEQRAGLVQQ